MALRHSIWMIFAVALLASACGSTPALPEEEIPGDFVFSYEMKATDEDAFLAWLAAEEEKKIPEPADEPATEPADETATEPADEAATEPADETATEPADETATEPADEPATEPADESATEPADEMATEPADEAATEPADEAATEPADEAATDPADETATEPADEAATEPEDVEGLVRTYIYIEIRDPGHVKYEVHFGFGNPVKRSGSVDLSETAFRKIYDLVRDADVFSLNKRYVGRTPTGKKETIVVKGSLRWMVIDMQGHVEPQLEDMWQGVKTILLDRHSRIFDNPKERADIYVLDKRNGEFHRGDCVRLNEVSAEFRIRLPSVQQCLNREGWPCETCRPLER